LFDQGKDTVAARKEILIEEQKKMEEKRRNFDFYEPMTVHESSLSPSVHAVLAAELGKE
jgi:maltose phosphorylase